MPFIDSCSLFLDAKSRSRNECLVAFYGLIISVYKQDQGLDVIAEGLDALKSMASDINEVCLPVAVDQHGEKRT